MTSWSTWSNGNADADFTEPKAPRTGSLNLTHWKSTAYQVYTYQTVTGLANGNYTLKAYVTSSGGHNQCQMQTQNFGGGIKMTKDITTNAAYAQFSILNINVTNGQCEIGFWSDGNAGNWLSVDDIQFYKQ